MDMRALKAFLLVFTRFLDLTSVGTHRSIKSQTILIGVPIQTKDLDFGLISPQLRRDLGFQLDGNILQYGLIVGAPFPHIKAVRVRVRVLPSFPRPSSS